jgi:Mn2+/Fe2+ NRAMP family transporter
VDRKHYSKKLLYPAVIGLVVANTLNAGADIGAIAAAMNLLIPIPAGALLVPIAAMIVVVQLWGSYRLIAQIFKWLALTLFAYIGAAILAKPPWGQVLRATFIPHFTLSAKYLLILVAIFGTTISPYLFFWEASQEVEEEIEIGRKTVAQREGATYAELRKAAWDTNIGMFFCNLVFYFVILASAATLHVQGKTSIQSASEAAEALRPLVGNGASVLFALGLIGSGFLAVPVLTGSSAYAVAETFGWECSLNDRPHEARQFYSVIGLSTFIGLLFNFVGLNPISALFWSAVINGLISPPLLVIIMVVTNSRRVMGEKVNSRLNNIFGWAATAVMFAAAMGLIVTWRYQ